MSGRLDVTRAFVSKVRYEAARIAYKENLVARNMAMWYQDYFIFKEDNNNAQKAEKVI